MCSLSTAAVHGIQMLEVRRGSKILNVSRRNKDLLFKEEHDEGKEQKGREDSAYPALIEFTARSERFATLFVTFDHSPSAMMVWTGPCY